MNTDEEISAAVAKVEAKYLRLAHEARKVVDLLREVGEDTRWRDGSQTDRVYAWFEFDDLRRLLGEAVDAECREGNGQ